MTSTRIAAALAALVTAAALSACSSNTATTENAGHAGHDTETATVTGQPAGFDADDVAFATNMIPHHEQAVQLSALVPDRSSNPELIDLAQRIAGAQQPEIETMKAFLVQWKENPQDSSGHGGHGGMAMSGMVDDATMTKLGTLKGAEFDTLWLRSMIGHHQGAIEMAKAELANGANVDAKELAQTIIDAQQAEIDQMNKMLGSTP